MRYINQRRLENAGKAFKEIVRMIAYLGVVVLVLLTIKLWIIVFNI